MAPRQTGIGYKKRRVRAGGLKKASSEEKPIGGKANKAEQQAQTPPTPPVLKTPSKLKARMITSGAYVRSHREMTCLSTLAGARRCLESGCRSPGEGAVPPAVSSAGPSVSSW